MNGPRLLAAVKTGLLVVLVSVLIWTWSEAESLRTAQVMVRIVFAEAEDLAVEGTAAEWDQSARVRLEGPTAAMDEAETALRGPVEIVLGRGGVPATPGTHQIDLRAALEAAPEIERTKVAVLECVPAIVEVKLVRLVVRELPVEADLSMVEVEGEVRVEPTTVRVRLPEELAAALGPETAATAVISPAEAASLSDQAPQTIRQARVQLPAGLADRPLVRVLDEHVSVTLRVRKRIETLTLSSVPVWVTMPPVETGKWDVEVLDPYLHDVTVTGPREEVQRIRREELRTIAFVFLSSDDLENQIPSKRAVFAPVPGALVSGDPVGAGAEEGPDAALLEQVAPLKFSAPARRVALAITRREPRPGGERVPEPGGEGPEPVPGGAR